MVSMALCHGLHSSMLTIPCLILAWLTAHGYHGFHPCRPYGHPSHVKPPLEPVGLRPHVVVLTSRRRMVFYGCLRLPRATTPHLDLGLTHKGLPSLRAEEALKGAI
jgi:hypothetical protein